MPDRVEEILKKIHVMFAKCEAYNDSADRVIVSKREMFELLEELSEALYEVLDRYEATARSREKARLEMDRQAAEIIAQAKSDADDVHAATLLYTDTMLQDMKDLIAQTRQSVKQQMLELLAQLEMQEDTLEENKEGVRGDLKELHDSEFYLKVLEGEREKAAKKVYFPEEDEVVVPEPEKASVVIRVDRPGTNSGVTYSTKRTRNKKKKNEKPAAGIDDETIELENPPESGAPVPRGTVFTADDFDLDAEFEEWEAQQKQENGEGAEEDKSGKGGLFGGLFRRKKDDKEDKQ